MYSNQCILCSGESLRLVREYSADRIVAGWQEKFKIDVSGDFRANTGVTLLFCENCGLLYFYPLISASDGLYSKLQSFGWYYLKYKWEFREALRDLHPAGRLLEIGCGSGEFIRMAAREGFKAEGIELNREAVKAAESNGLPVANIDLLQLASEKPSEYDAVCAFQVLEHVPDPVGFLSACVRLLKVGGTLAFSVPNEDSFIQFDLQDLLNLPPHHVTRWSYRTANYLPQLFSIKLQRICYEPLAEYHLDWYLSVQQNRLSGKNSLSRSIQRTMGIFVNSVLKPTGLYRFIRGHTMYCSYKKVSDGK